MFIFVGPCPTQPSKACISPSSGHNPLPEAKIDSYSIQLCPHWPYLPGQEQLLTLGVSQPRLQGFCFCLVFSEPFSPDGLCLLSTTVCGLAFSSRGRRSSGRGNQSGSQVLPLQRHQPSESFAEWPPAWPNPVSQPQFRSQNHQLFPGKMQLHSFSLPLKGPSHLGTLIPQTSWRPWLFHAFALSSSCWGSSSCFHWDVSGLGIAPSYPESVEVCQLY